jgi:outer membrane protein TolC
LHASEATRDKSIADYRQTVVTALQDVEDSLSAAAKEQQVELADRAAADAARKAATLADAQYKLGTIDFLTVLDTQRTLYQSEDTLVQTRLARLQASVSLFRAFGGGYGVTAQNGDGDSAASGKNAAAGPIGSVHSAATTALVADASAQRPSLPNPIAP